MLIMNATEHPQRVIAFGNHFTFNPGQIKTFQEHIGHFLATERREFGLVDLPEAFEDLEYRATDEGKRLLAEKRKEGIDAYCRKLREIIYNNQVSLRQDLEKANMKVDPATLASSGELAAMEILSHYQQNAQDADAAKAKKVKELMQKVGSVTR